MWRKDGDKLVLMIDANKNLNKVKLEKELISQLHMINAMKSRINCPGPNTFHLGSKKVDRIWITQDLDISSACFLPFYFGIRDYRGIIINFYSSLVLSTTLITIKKLKIRRLVVQDKQVIKIYLHLVKEFDKKHNIYMKLHNLINSYR